MIVVAAHSSTPRLGIAVVRDREVLVEEVLPAGREHLENIAPVFRRVMDGLDMEPKDLDGLGVARGPGSFSGIRVGMSFIKGIGLVLGLPVVGISCLEILARNGLLRGECGAAIIDARRGEVYVAAYRRTEKGLIGLDEPRLLRVSEFEPYANTLGEQLVLCGDPVAEGLEASCIKHVRVLSEGPLAARCALMALERFNDATADDLHALSPLYIRRSDAEEKKGASLYYPPHTHAPALRHDG